MSSLRWKLQNFVQGLFLCTWSVIWISSALLVSIVSSELPLVMARRIWGPGLIWFAQAEVEVVGGDGLDVAKPYIYVMNHQSMIDIPIAFAHLPSNLRFVAKKILKSIPFLGWYMWRTRMVFVDRKNRTQALSSLRRAGEQIRAGASILAYPEGTRSRDGAILPFKKGPFVVAIEAGVPIVPVAIDGSGAVLPSDGFRIRPGRVALGIGAPIQTAGLKQSDVNALVRQVRDAIIELHQRIGGAGGDRDDAIAMPGHEGIGQPRSSSSRRHAA